MVKTCMYRTNNQVSLKMLQKFFFLLSSKEVITSCHKQISFISHNEIKEGGEF